MIHLLLAVVLFGFLIYLSKRMKLEPLDTCKKQTDCSEMDYCYKSNCVKKLAINNTCNSDVQCRYGKCDANTNRCKLSGKDESCNVNLDCESGICDGSLHCK